MLLAPDGTNRISQFGLSQGMTLYSFMRDATEALLEWPAYVLTRRPSLHGVMVTPPYLQFLLVGPGLSRP